MSAPPAKKRRAIWRAIWREICEIITETGGLSPRNALIQERLGMQVSGRITVYLRRCVDLGFLRVEGGPHERVIHVLKWPKGMQPVATTGRMPRKKVRGKARPSTVSKPGSDLPEITVARKCLRCGEGFVADTYFLRQCPECRGDEYVNLR